MNHQSHPQADPANDSPQHAQQPDPTANEQTVPEGEPTTQADQAAAADAALESRDEAMDRMAQEVEQARQRVLMAQAELENFRKRTRKDYEEQLRYAALPLVEDILQVRDNLVRAIEAAGSTSEATEAIEGLKSGVELVTKQLDDVLAKHGVKPIPAVGEVFDPNFHQAIAQTPSDQHQEGIVAIEATAGFQMHERVVRPSQVVVSTGAAQQ
jgi:molecular chaperone GrpE